MNILQTHSPCNPLSTINLRPKYPQRGRGRGGSRSTKYHPGPTPQNALPSHRGESVKRIAIVGGGIAGLTAAYELAQQARNGAEIEVVLFESSNRLGGIVETVREGCFTI